MRQLDRLIEQASRVASEAIVLSSHRAAQLLVEGNLRPVSARPLSTEEIMRLVTEVAPQNARAAMGCDCALTFPYQGAGLPAMELKVNRQADFIFVRIEPRKVETPPAPGPSSAGALSEATLFDGLELDDPEGGAGPFAGARPASVSGPTAPAAGAAAGDLTRETARDFEMQADDAPLELDTDAGALPERESGTERSVELEDSAPAALALEEEEELPELESLEEIGAEEELASVEPVEEPAAAAPRRPAEPAGRSPERARAAAAAAREPSRLGAGTPLPRLLQALVERGGSDLHVAACSPPRMRLCGELVAVSETAFTPEQTQAMWASVLDSEQRRRFEEEQSLDFSIDLKNIGRFRANTYRQRRGIDLVFRSIPHTIPTLAQLGLPPAAEKLTEYPNGLILVTGPAGCGKSTTQAAIIDRINETWHDHVITVEDPVEFVHPVKNCLINQREVGTHVRSFAEALKSALREDPDVILVGELRDLETISLAITAAETGHLVLGTLHTIDAARTIDRLIDVFPGEQKLQIRSMVSESLRGVISQRLLPAADGKGRVAAFELLLSDRSVSNMIREGKTFQIANLLRMGKSRGMCAMDDAIIGLVQAGKVSPEVAKANMDRPEDLEKQLAAQQPARPGRPRPPGTAGPAGATASGAAARRPGGK